MMGIKCTLTLVTYSIIHSGQHFAEQSENHFITTNFPLLSPFGDTIR